MDAPCGPGGGGKVNSAMLPVLSFNQTQGFSLPWGLAASVSKL